ncbi:MAG: anthranilate phosphoribosyltransferase [Candidatus Omnitrophota bacterium]
MIKDAIGKLAERSDLTREEMILCMNEIMTGEATPSQIASFITALRMKGETVEEITGATMVMREKATRLKVKSDIIVDTCGTGGSGKNIFNVSTCNAFVLAGLDLKVAKHGNRSVSSACGSADVLKELGVNIELEPGKVEKCISAIGIGFLFAPLFHGAMKYAIGPRREIGIRTIFNILGPLTNPAGANVQVLGVYRGDLVEVLANVLKNLGSIGAFVVHGEDGLDEITTTGKTKVSQLKDNSVKTFFVRPEDFGVKRAKLIDLKGSGPEENANIIKDILSGKSSPKRELVLVNASTALVAANKVRDFKKGIELAKSSIDTGKAKKKLDELIEFTNR